MTFMVRNFDLRMPDYWPPHPTIWQRHRSAVLGLGPVRMGANVSYFGSGAWAQIGPFNLTVKFDRKLGPA